MSSGRLIVGLLLGLVFDRVDSVQGQEPTPLASYIQLHYIKSEHMIPMRDGVKLHTHVYRPRDTTKTYPILIKRTPYSVTPYGPDKYPAALGPSEGAVKAGYIFVNQDVRGRYLSEGEFLQVTPHRTTNAGHKGVDESTDAYDTVEWLVKNVPGHNGRVGMYGVSYPGFYASAGMIDAHPALKAVSPQAPVSDWYFDDFLHNGAFFLAHAYRWIGQHARPRPKPITERFTAPDYPTYDGYQFFFDAGNNDTVYKQHLKENNPFWAEMMAHPDRDAHWQARNILPHLKNVAPAVMVVTGWYDAEDLFGSFKTYQSIEKLNPTVNNVLVVGPWSHGGWSGGDGDKLGPASFGSKTAAFYRNEIELPFFEKYLKDAAVPAPAEATVFETGANAWRTFDHWPPKNVQRKTWYFSKAGQLSEQPPVSGDQAYDEYVSDPARPVPTTESIAPGMPIEYMVDDQRFAARRPDVLVYQLPEQTEDLILAGPVQVDLWVTTTGQDADFYVKLIDVFPPSPDKAAQPGYQMQIRSEVFRGRYRNSFEKPEPFVPGEPARIRFELQDVFHRFQKGHRVMVHIQSTCFPLVDRNPQTWVPNIHFAKPEDFQKATHRVLRSGSHLSNITLGVLPAAR